MNLEQILAHFEGVSKSGDGYRAKCSAHSDKTPSLSIGEGDAGPILIKCHKGCETKDVLSAVGLTFRDLYTENASSKRNTNCPSIPNSSSSKTKPATALSETEVNKARDWYRHLRENFASLTRGLAWTKLGIKEAGAGYDPDTGRFVFIHRDSDGVVVNIKHHKGPDGQSPFSVEGHGQNSLYPGHLIGGFDPKQPGILCEGEKDAVTLISNGFQAITGTTGATSVVEDLSALSKLEELYICLDHGEAGQKGAKMWADALSQQCPDVTVYVSTWPEEKPEGYDITAFFNEEHSPCDFKTLMMTDIEPYEMADPKTTGDQYGREPVLVRMADVQPEGMSWLWEPYIPLGKITILEGDPGATKSWLTLKLGGIVTRGDPFPGPDGSLRANNETPGIVIFCSAEDSLADTLRPRLDSANADPDRVLFLTGSRLKSVQSGESQGAITLQDLSVIEQALARYQPRLFVIDPIQAYIGSRVDVNRTNEVRPILAKLGKLAERYRCAIICVRHITKKTSRGKALYRGQGSIDFTAAARSVLLVAPDPEDPLICVIAHIKSNLSVNGPSQRYRILDGVFTWEGISDLTADDLLRPNISGEQTGALGDAKEFLLEMLREGSCLTTVIFEEAGQLEISVSSLRRAKKVLGIVAKRHGGIGESGAWSWSLPDD